MCVIRLVSFASNVVLVEMQYFYLKQVVATVAKTKKEKCNIHSYKRNKLGFCKNGKSNAEAMLGLKIFTFFSGCITYKKCTREFPVFLVDLYCEACCVWHALKQIHCIFYLFQNCTASFGLKSESFKQNL